jgi:regulation of enolase protein 1 (concanavalin A-like superfamily)
LLFSRLFVIFNCANINTGEKMKAYIHIFIAVLVVGLLSFETASAYEPAVQWQKTFGGSNNDHGYSIQQTSDGGYIIAGETWSFGAGTYPNVYLLKIDSAGNMQWQKTFGGSGWDRGWSVQQTSDDGYIVAGDTYSPGVDEGDIYLVKTDSDGNLIWHKTFGGSKCDWEGKVRQTTDGGYIIAGSTSSFGAGRDDVYLIKTDPNGNFLWQNTFGGSNWENGYSVQQTTDGGYIIGGKAYGEGYQDVYLVKADSAGNLKWQKTFGGSGSDRGYSVHQTSDGGYIIAGRTASFGAGWLDVYLIKTDPNGNLLWQKTFGGSNDDVGYSVQQTSDGGYIIAGSTESAGYPDHDVYLTKVDSIGNLQWEKTFGGSFDDYGHSVQQTTDGGFIIAGVTSSFGARDYDVYLIKLSAEVCQYMLFGDLNDDCKFDFYDFALMAANWLTDCNINPSDPACTPK